MITNKQKFSMMFYLSRAFFLGIGTSLVLSSGKRDAWFGAILGLLIGLLMVLCVSYIQKRKQNVSIYNIFKEMKFIGWLIKLLMIIFAIFIIVQALVILQTYTSSFFLLKTPPWIIELAVLSAALYIVSKGLNSTFRMAEIFLPLSILIFVFCAFNLFPHVKLDNFLPIFTTKTTSILKSALFFSTFSAAPILLMVQLNDNGKYLIPSYLISSITIVLVISVCLGVFGVHLANIFRYPEYVALKKISIFNFIEKVENILSINWVIDLIGIIVLATHFLKDVMPSKKGKCVFTLIITAIFIFSSFAFGTYYSLDTSMYYYSSYVLLGLFIVIVGPLIFYLKLKKDKN